MTKKIILDCDPGHDDAVAIMLAASSKEIDILGITCVGGNSGLNNTVNNALKVCTLIERTDIKVYSGANKPIHYELFTAEYVHGKTGLDKKGDPIIIDTNYKPQEKHAVDFIVETCKSSTEQIYLCPTGPLTNIALSLKKDPSIKENIKEIVFMGGAAMCLGNTTPSAEFNIYVDPHAANIVLESGIPLTMMGLDVTHQVNVNSKIIKSMNENKNKSSKFFGELMEFYTIFHKELYETEETPLHDPCVIAYLLDPSIFSGKEVNVTVEENSELTRGETVVDWLGVTKRPVNCFVMNEANDEKFFQLLKAKLSLLKKKKKLFAIFPAKFALLIIKDTLAFRVSFFDCSLISFMRNGVNSFPLILFLSAFIVALFIHFSTSFLLSAFSNGTLLNMRIDFLFPIFSLSFKKEEIS